ncbi:Stf0 family sulfotransferase [Solimonas sp. SE-A11]|uniref:Stf0 family sulfotransferase n=1 Tax=Solimonas sp. SE-A11 TaxID=3054954 RepID=UPI00259C8779|nr:Stf0 family sulfotransferase [Solimonas sp. SE-A11]MDM4772586.1 Stf0 family sulfotransferase [Solimonas sp. SE-A11]
MVSAGHDYPEWQGAPRRSLILISHPRSGSTLLAEALHAAGGLGNPLEYLHAGFRPTFARRWQAESLPQYLTKLHRLRTDPGGTLGIKLFWRDLRETAVEAGIRSDQGPNPPPGGEDYMALHTHLQRVLPNPVFVYLYREDRLRAAISAYIASKTGVFRALTPEQLQRTRREVEYDYEGIRQALAAFDAAHAHWRAYFAASGIRPLRLSYEELQADYHGSVTNVITSLGGSGQKSLPAPRLTRQSSRHSETLLLRFLRDHAERCPASN